jgi:hypothetical protein
MDTYEEAHLLVAAIRVLHHRNGGPPTVEEVCDLIAFGSETAHALCRTLEKIGAIEVHEDPFALRLTLKNQLALEELPKMEQKKSSLEDELAKFQAKKGKVDDKVAAMQQELKKKKQDLFADIEAKLKKDLKKS